MADTPEKSGLSPDEQISSTTNKSSIESGTSNGNKNAKKYDLGVLFVHGIGRQAPGDTFNGIYNPIKNELESNTSIKYQESQNSSSAEEEIEGDILCVGSSSKSVIFRESHWHEPNNDSKSPNKNILDLAVGYFVAFFSILLWPIYFIGLRIFMDVTRRKNFLYTTFIFVNIAVIYLAYVPKDNKNFDYIKSLQNTQDGRIQLLLAGGFCFCGCVYTNATLEQAMESSKDCLSGVFVFNFRISIYIYARGSFRFHPACYFDPLLMRIGI